MADRLGVTTKKSLYVWIKRYTEQHPASKQHDAEIQHLKGELRRVTEERDILKKATKYFAKESR